MSTSNDDEVEYVVIPKSSKLTDLIEPPQPVEIKTEPLTNELFYKNFKFEPVKEDSENLPFAYYSPESDGKVTWNCSKDYNGKITSVFSFLGGQSNGESDKRCTYLQTEDEAKVIRDELKKAGWQISQQPKIKTKIPGEDRERPLNRRESRFLQRKLERDYKKIAHIK